MKPLTEAAPLAALPEPWGSMLAALEALDRLGDTRYNLAKLALAEQRRAIDALTEQHDVLAVRCDRLAEIIHLLFDAKPDA